MLVFTCIYYGIFNVFVGPITEELFFGSVTSSDADIDKILQSLKESQPRQEIEGA